MNRQQRIEAMEAERQQKDVRAIEEGYLWPHYPFIPVKRYVNGDMECALMVDRMGWNVWIGNLFEVATILGPGAHKVSDMLADCPKLEYANAQEWLDAGWRID